MFPAFKTWCSAFRLSMLAYFGVIIFPFFFWQGVLLGCLLLISGELQPSKVWLAIAGISLACLLIGFVLYLIVKLLWRFILRLLWSNPPQLLIPTSGFKVNLHKFIVLSVATLPIAAIFMLIIAAKTSVHVTTGVAIINRQGSTVDFMIRLYWLWLLTAAYLLHWFPINKTNIAKNSNLKSATVTQKNQDSKRTK